MLKISACVVALFAAGLISLACSSSAPDGSTCSGPMPPCALPPDPCPDGYRLTPQPCSCTVCAPVDGGTSDAGKPDTPVICNVMCPMIDCTYGYLPNPDPCGCPICAPVDAGIAKDGSQDSLVCLHPPCPQSPQTCPAGSQLVSPPCGCASCVPVDGGTALDGTTTNTGPSCSMSASQYDNSCKVDSDCVAVPSGDPCVASCASICSTAALNVRVASQYLADFRALVPGGNDTVVCFCPCLAAQPCCRQGVCHNLCGECNGTN